MCVVLCDNDCVAMTIALRVALRCAHLRCVLAYRVHCVVRMSLDACVALRVALRAPSYLNAPNRIALRARVCACVCVCVCMWRDENVFVCVAPTPSVVSPANFPPCPVGVASRNRNF